MTYREDETYTLLKVFLDLIQKNEQKLSLRAGARLLETLLRQAPIYPGLISERLKSMTSRTVQLRKAGRETQTEKNGTFKEPLEDTIPDNWKTLAAKLERTAAKHPTPKSPFCVMVLGGPDTGKTFLVTYLANRLVKSLRPVAVLDCDTGQSDIGPPGTLGLALLKKPALFLHDLSPHSLYFVGSHSASLHFLPTLAGTHQLVCKAKKLSELVLIDTSGWINGDGARALRQAEMELVQPELIVLLQKEKELEPLVRNYPAGKIVRCSVSENAAATSAEKRKKLRETQSKKYFSGGRTFDLYWEMNGKRALNTDRAYFLSGEKIVPRSAQTLWAERLSGPEGILAAVKKPLTTSESDRLKKEFSVDKVKTILPGSEKGVLAALCDSGREVLALGIIMKIDYRSKKIKVYSPIEKRKISRVKIIQFGSLRSNPDGTEAGFVEPGTF